VPVQTHTGPTIMTVVGHSQGAARLPPTIGNLVSDRGTWLGRLSQPSENQAKAAAARRHADRQECISTSPCFGGVGAHAAQSSAWNTNQSSTGPK